MELKRISVSDIDPDQNNPRRDFGDIKAFAATFMANPWAPGEPFNPIVVVADGERYRIADGERRYHAMVQNEIKECSAVVCGDYDEAQNAIVALASDAKKPLSEMERSRAVQTALSLGVAPKSVEAAGGLKRGQARKVAEAAKWAGEKALQSTLDQLLEAKALEDAGATREEARSVLEAQPDAWKDIARAVKSDLETQKRVGQMREILNEKGVELSTPSEDMAYDRMFQNPLVLKEHLESEAAEAEGLAYCLDEAQGVVDVYRPRSGADDEVPAYMAKAAAMAEDVTSQGANDREDWYLASLERRPGHPEERVRLTPHVDALVCSWYDDISGISESFRYAGHDPEKLAVPKTIYAPFALAAYEEIQEVVEVGPQLVRMLVLDEAVDADEELSAWQEWFEAFVQDGFEPSKEETEIFDKAAQAISSYTPKIQASADSQTPADPVVLDMSADADEAQVEHSDQSDLIDLADLNFGQAVI